MHALDNLDMSGPTWQAGHAARRTPHMATPCPPCPSCRGTRLISVPAPLAHYKVKASVRSPPLAATTPATKDMIRSLTRHSDHPACGPPSPPPPAIGLLRRVASSNDGIRGRTCTSNVSIDQKFLSISRRKSIGSDFSRCFTA